MIRKQTKVRKAEKRCDLPKGGEAGVQREGSTGVLCLVWGSGEASSHLFLCYVSDGFVCVPGSRC